MSRAGLQCPNCLRADNVQKVSAIVSAGTSFSTYTGYGSGVGYSSDGGVAIDEVVTFSGSSQTALSSLLSPPTQPTYSSSWGGVIFATIVILAVLVIILLLIPTYVLNLINPANAGYSLQDYGQSILALIGLVIIAPLCVWALVAIYRYTKRKNALNYAQYMDQMPHWQSAMAKWEDLFYCHRCDGVFLPGQSFFVPTIDMMDFLYDPHH